MTGTYRLKGDNENVHRVCDLFLPLSISTLQFPVITILPHQGPVFYSLKLFLISFKIINRLTVEFYFLILRPQVLPPSYNEHVPGVSSPMTRL